MARTNLVGGMAAEEMYDRYHVINLAIGSRFLVLELKNVQCKSRSNYGFTSLMDRFIGTT